MNCTTTIRRGLRAPALAALILGGVAAPAAADTAGDPGGVTILDSRSNLFPEGFVTPAETAGTYVAADIIGPEPPSNYRLYETHFYSEATCASRGRMLIDIGSIDNYWCTPVKQENGRHWLYIYGFCNTDSIGEGAVLSKDFALAE